MPFYRKKHFLLILFLSISWSASTQDNIAYSVETFGSTATGDFTPFWIVNNTYGIVPIHSNNAYLRGMTFWNHKLNKDFELNAGVDLVGAVHHSSSFFIQQLYGDIAFQKLHLTIGSKEYDNSILDYRLSSGDMDFSTNARPIPEIKLSIPEFTKVPYTKGIFYIRGDFAVGKFTDSNYTIRTKSPEEDYATDILLHHKSLFFLLKDPNKQFPLSFMFGLEHAAQWGGWTSVSDIGYLPHSFSDFMSVVFGGGGGSSSPLGDQINELGNHQGTLNCKLNYQSKIGQFSIYKQHFFDDKSGLEYANWRDGIWGLEFESNTQSFIQKIVLEYIHTTDQSGPMHMLYLESEDRDIRGGGNDDYYNHDYYVSGWSHWGRTLGNPLITSPEYNSSDLYFKNNRVKALHLGVEGNITSTFSYRTLFTSMNTWGRMTFPFLQKKNGFSSLLECNYIHPKYEGWTLGIQLALDQGALYGDNFGCSLKISKSGIIRF